VQYLSTRFHGVTSKKALTLLMPLSFFANPFAVKRNSHSHAQSYVSLHFWHLPRFRRTNRHVDAFVLKILQSALTPFWSGQIYALTSLTKRRNSKGKVTVDLLKPLSVSNLLFSREIFCSGTTSDQRVTMWKSDSLSFMWKTSDVAKNGCAEPYNEKILCRLMAHSYTLRCRAHT